MPRTARLTEWLQDDETLLARIERALAELEATEYRRYVRDLFPISDGYNKSIPVEAIAEKTGLSPHRIIRLVGDNARKIKYKRVKCRSRSRYGWCLRHIDYEYGVSLVDPRLVSQATRLKEIRRRLKNCLEGPVILVLGEKIHIYRRTECGATREEILGMLAEAAMIAEELGLNEERVREWLGLDANTVFYLDDGEKLELEKLED